MPHDIIDNRNEKLLDHMQRILPRAEAAKFAVGYFFLSGLESVADSLDNMQELRLLIGNTTNRRTIEQIAEGYRRLDRVQQQIEQRSHPGTTAIGAIRQNTARDVGHTAALMDQTDESEHLINTLVRLISERRLKVRVYTKGRLHAKAYIYDYGSDYDIFGNELPQDQNGTAIVGSSNFSLAGVSSNTELNVRVHGNANHAELTRWFEELWDEATPFAQHLMEELELSWARAQVTPYEIYLKTLYELVRESVEAQPEVVDQRDEVMAALTGFQRRAVQRAVRMIRQYRGCFVSDVVGLGKSYIGSAILRHFVQTDGARPLIICPARLAEMWEHYSERFDLNARVLSMGMLTEHDVEGPEWLRNDLLYRNRDLVLVDESHNFRHRDTQRYRVLQSFLASDERRAVFLTATPRSSSLWDIYYQIKLFHQTDVTHLPIDPPDLRQYFQMIDQGTRRLPSLLSHLLIRRTRQHVLRWYGYDADTDQPVDPERFRPYKTGQKTAYIKVAGEKNYFPVRQLETVSYSIEETYGGLYDEIYGYIAGPDETHSCDDHQWLTYARYGLGRYVRQEFRTQNPYRDLQSAGRNLRGLIRIMLFKRFESSVYAFRQTVTRMRHTQRTFLDALDQGIVAAGEEAATLLGKSDELADAALYDALQAVTGDYDVEGFQTEALRHDIEQDLRVLDHLLDITAPITSAEDDKLQTLLRRLHEPGMEPGKHLIFTQFADTAEYLYREVCSEMPNCEMASSERGGYTSIVARFAPKANPELRRTARGPEIDTLVATDVLAEGLNLQDCDKVINYDLHWNPVRLIQRLGRIDRIGSEHETVHAYNFLPETGLERNLGLRERLQLRISEIHRTIGEDSAILQPDEQLNENAMYAIYAGGQLGPFETDSDEDAYVDLEEAEETIRRLRDEQPELYERIANLRDGVRCGRSTKEQRFYVFCRAGRYRQLYLMDEEGNVLTREVPRILHWLRCDPDTQPLPVPAKHNTQVMAIKRQFDQEVAKRRAEQRHTTSFTRAQRYVLRHLRLLYDQSRDADHQRQIEQLDAALRQSIVRPAVREELNRLRRAKATDDVLLQELVRIYRTYNLDEPYTPPQDEQEDEIPRIVCSEAGRKQTR